MSMDFTDYRDIFLNDRPMMDARAPIEFVKGSFPGVVNLPLMSDNEREQIGTCYKQHGQQAAIALGQRLVSGEVKDRRIQAWVEFARANPEGYLYCFRGGLRSQIVQQWIKEEAGIDYPRIGGGYKSMRTFLLETVDQAVEQCDFVLLGGMTGTGKTEVLAQLSNGLDLEGHANHRGSSFGKRATGQPTNIDFENRLAVDVLKKRATGIEQFVLEDESRMVGSCALPLPLYQGMQGFAMVWLEDSVEGRVERILQDYVINLHAEFVALHGDQGFELYAERLISSLNNIYRRLGGERHQRMFLQMEDALAEQARTGSVELFRDWIEVLLGEYYDPMYAFQREKKGHRIEFSGEQGAVLEYLRERPNRLG
ncbi:MULTISPECIES: tRNA 2-selenouridine(34) synthase MnmH [unclassified Pseudomonas]|uniref:tRNA 2-selenouridine(34) synthase MnmH n=1 Tax=unclassified Pseudomonas TaxID=196821 RepID=UPI002AC8A778|nr:MULTISPECIES: tRNA 2-selenouridine(34) synthase MnmH [unclassified Pseudomonas]MEB0047045.1 tRNA 2-selenouridine(34) synthase MnmH [Pseudomonas sp. Dout3]MEB0097803.1 tRNA 2-selenouridine(34) synthase MnmH [Pseudomonas sp. DC1.2]WPX57196.1 tRNA 2-selenouridine(34) synthase MnmH [Pseudomonas sp. DC1.2]